MKKNLVLTLILMFGIICYAEAQSTSTTVDLINNTSCAVTFTLVSDNGISCVGGTAQTNSITLPAHSTLSYTVSTAPWRIGTPHDFNFIGVTRISPPGTIKVADPASCNGFPTSASWTDCTPTGTITWTDAPTSPPAPTPTTATITFN